MLETAVQCLRQQYFDSTMLETAVQMLETAIQTGTNWEGHPREYFALPENNWTW